MKKFLLCLLPLFFASSLFASSAGLEKALRLLNEGKTDQAMALVKEELQNNPSAPDHYLAMGIIHLEQNSYGKAKENLEKALSLDSGIVAAHYMLALIYEKEGERAEAVEKWRNILRYSSDGALRSLADKHIRQLEGE